MSALCVFISWNKLVHLYVFNPFINWRLLWSIASLLQIQNMDLCNKLEFNDDEILNAEILLTLHRIDVQTV